MCFLYSLIRSTGVFSGMAESQVDAGTVDRSIVLKSVLIHGYNVNDMFIYFRGTEVLTNLSYVL